MTRTTHPFIKSIRSDSHKTTQIAAPETTVRQTERTPLENELLAALKKLAFLTQSFIGQMAAEDLATWDEARAVITKAERG